MLPPDADLIRALEASTRSNVLSLSEENCRLGTWVHPETKNVDLGVTTSRNDLDETLRVIVLVNAASSRKTIAVYNSSMGDTVYL